MLLVGIEATAFLDTPALIDWILYPFAWAIYAIFAIATHRMVLLGPESVPKWGITSWSKRETYFILHAVGIGLLLFPLALLGMIPIIGSVVAVTIYLWLLGRLSLVFPGIAIDKGVTFKLSWDLTANYQISILLVILVPPLILAIPTLVLGIARTRLLQKQIQLQEQLDSEALRRRSQARLVTQQEYWCFTVSKYGHTTEHC